MSPATDSPPTNGVLIVDGSEENREVLRTVLAQRGITTWEADEARAGARLAHQHRPRVIVVDTESPHAAEALAEWKDCSRHGSAVVLLGAATSPQANHRVIAKPYHYGPLIRTIEELVAPVRSPSDE